MEGKCACDRGEGGIWIVLYINPHFTFMHQLNARYTQITLEYTILGISSNKIYFTYISTTTSKNKIKIQLKITKPFNLHTSIYHWNILHWSNTITTTAQKWFVSKYFSSNPTTCSCNSWSVLRCFFIRRRIMRLRLRTMVMVVSKMGRNTSWIQREGRVWAMVVLLVRRAWTMEALPWIRRWLMETQSGRGAGVTGTDEGGGGW